MEILLPENHILYTSSNDVKQICEPLKSYFGLDHFSFVKINPDLSRIHLDGNVEWNKHFYQNFHHYFKNSGLTEGKHWQSGYSLLYMLEEQECIKDAGNFDIGNGIVIANHNAGITELAYFALAKKDDETKIIKLLNNIDALENFINYFKFRADQIIVEAEKNPIKIPFLENREINNFSVDSNILENFLKSINIQASESLNWVKKERPSIRFLYNFENKFLTKRERDCIEFLAKGYTAKMIARELCLSPRTVEYYVENIKEKFEVSTKTALVSKLYEGR